MFFKFLIFFMKLYNNKILWKNMEKNNNKTKISILNNKNNKNKI